MKATPKCPGLIIALLVLACSVSCLFNPVPLNIEGSSSIENTNSVNIACAMVENERDLESCGITNHTAIDIIKGGDPLKSTWIFSTLPIGRVLYQKQGEMVIIVPTSDKNNDRLYFIKVAKIPRCWVKMAAVEMPKASTNRGIAH